MKLSIRLKILLALLIVIFLMSIPYAFLIIPGLRYKQQYDGIIQNITSANGIRGNVKQSIDAEIWTIIIGQKSFAEGKQYAVIADVDGRIQEMMRNTDSEHGQLKLDVIRRTIDTLRTDIDQLGMRLTRQSTFDQNVPLMERIRDVSQLIEDNIQDYALFEVNRTEKQYLAMQESLTRWAIGGLIIISAVVIFAIFAAWRIARGIYVPIKKLHDVTRTIAREDLEVLVTSDNADEMTELGRSFNLMVGKIRELLDSKIKEQEQLKKAELRVLQAQINPHFLYNTLDAIVWMARAGRTANIIELVQALSRFFRISLSKGKDWITIQDEVEHIASYLTIQKMRYRDILDYEINVPPDLLRGEILKLTLQPLVENALYHGIKNKRSGGKIVVGGERTAQDQLRLWVEDNGIGIAEDRLGELRALIDGDPALAMASDLGYGINNVQQRIKLYYGREYGLSLESEYQRGTRVSLLIPLQTSPAVAG